MTNDNSVVNVGLLNQVNTISIIKGACSGGQSDSNKQQYSPFISHKERI
ncbi:MAG: hypothetical protein K0R46_3485 [Herbinix sp.]|jgi:hypothetical protein|nr:hypothetical protein [Herbinix sp.]